LSKRSTNKNVIDDIARGIKIVINNKNWEVLKAPFNVKSYHYKDGIGTINGINNEYTIYITAEKLFSEEECQRYHWKICKHSVSICLDEHKIMDVIISSGNQYPLIAEYISQFVFSKLWAKYCSLYTEEEKLNWF
jgi:hypothetical protein